jgi:rod shape-determining protein MreD
MSDGWPLRIPRKLVWILGLFFVQQLPGVSSWGVDLPLLFTVLVGLRSSPAKAAGWGFLMGLFQDLLSTDWIGPNTVAKTLVGLLASFSQRHVYRERVLTQTFLIFIMTFLHQILIWVLLTWDGSAPPASDAIWICLKTTAGTTLAGAVACFFVVRFRRRRFDPATA